MNSSRRFFLKVAGLSAFALAGGAGAAMAAGSAPAPAGRGSYEASEKALKAGRWAMVIDTRKLNTVERMRKVIDACHKYHNVPDIPGTQEVKWLWDDTTTPFPTRCIPCFPPAWRKAASSCCATTAKILPVYGCAR